MLAGAAPASLSSLQQDGSQLWEMLLRCNLDEQELVQKLRF